MQGVEPGDRDLLDAQAFVGGLVPEQSVFGWLARHRRELFPDAEFVDLFPSRLGRPSLPGSVAAAVMTLQALYHLSDLETAEAVRFDLRWKVATGMAVDARGFHPTTLVYWRRRLARSDRPHRINEAVRAVIEATGVLAGRRGRAVDSTVLDDAVATQDTITQLIAAIRRVGRQVPGGPELIAAHCTGHDYTGPGKPQIDWDDPAAKQELVSALVNDAVALSEAIQLPEDADESAHLAVGLLALVAGQDVEPAPGSDGTDGRWRIAARVAPERVISTVDPEARHTRKSRHQRRDGYRAHVVAEPATGIITDEALTPAAGEGNSDAAVAETFVAAQTATGPQPATEPERDPAAAPVRWYGDTAYSTGALRDAIDRAGHQAVIKPSPLRRAVPGGFTVDDFTVDETAGTLTCPNQVTRPIRPGRTVSFGTACTGCPLRDQCTTATDARGRALTLRPHDRLARQARHTWATDPDLRADYRQQRPNVERAIAQIATRGGQRLRLRYLGTIRNHAWLKRRTAALNLRNLINRGLTHTNGTWALAT